MKYNTDKVLKVCNSFVENELALDAARGLEYSINKFHQTASPDALARHDDGIVENVGKFTLGAVTYGYAYGVAETKAHYENKVKGTVALLGLGFLLYKFRKPIMSAISSKFKKKETVIKYGTPETK